MATIMEALEIAIQHHQAGRLLEAETIYGRILEADPQHVPTTHLLGVLSCQTGRLDTALELLEGVVKRSAANLAYRVDYAKALLAARNWTAALRALRPVLELAPDMAEGWHLSALALHHGDAGDRAITALERVRALEPGRSDAAGRLALLRRQRGREHLERGRHGPALEDLRRAAAIIPDDAELHALLATALLDSGRSGEAVAGFRRALALDPQCGALYNLGIALTGAGREEEALAAWQRAARLDPGHIAVRDALVLALKDRAPDAAAHWSTEVLDLKRRRAERALAEQPPLPAEPSGIGARTRNVVSFSLWGTREVYTQGAIANAREVPAVFPNWTCRFYHDDSVPRPLLAELGRLGAELVEMPAGSGPAQGLFWRFLASDDPTVARFLCRDCDSRPTAREKAAVDAWIASGLPFHVMRDNVAHTDLILAGMWGGVAGLLAPMAPLIASAASPDTDRWQDQRFLAEWVWPRIQGRVLVHDSVHPGAGLPFPPAPDDPVSPHIGAKVLQLRPLSGGLAFERHDPPAGSGHPAVAERLCRHGPMRFFVEDAPIGRSLALYGEWREAECRLAAALLAAGDVVVEAGSNLGAHTVALARAVGPTGLVHAFEPQRGMFDLLARNVAANNLDNVVPHRAAVGGERGGADGGAIPVETVDGLGLDRLALLKTEVGGMEALVLAGAASTIARCRPAIYLGNGREEHSADLIATIRGFGYRLWWHIVPVYDPTNIAGEGHNAFPGVVSINLLALPPDRPCPLPGLPEILSPSASWREAAWSA